MIQTNHWDSCQNFADFTVMQEGTGIIIPALFLSDFARLIPVISVIYERGLFAWIRSRATNGLIRTGRAH